MWARRCSMCCSRHHAPGLALGCLAILPMQCECHVLVSITGMCHKHKVPGGHAKCMSSDKTAIPAVHCPQL